MANTNLCMVDRFKDGSTDDVEQVNVISGDHGYTCIFTLPGVKAGQPERRGSDPNAQTFEQCHWAWCKSR